MLGKPRFGWVEITINNKKIGTASYLDWIPGLILNSCIRYLKACKEDKELYDFIDGKYGFNIEFDAEGYNFGIVEIGENFYTYDTCGNTEPYINLKEIDLNLSDGYKFVYNLTKEVIKDIELEYEAWVEWGLFTTDEEEYNNNKESLDKLLQETKKILNECTNLDNQSIELGNLLFGNSRGNYLISDRENWQNTFWKYFENDFDTYGFYDNFKKDSEHTTDRGGYENDVFLINPYYWGDDEEIAKLPNFIYKPKNLEIQWYKYPFRSAYINQNISLDEMEKIWSHCIKSMHT